MSAISATAPAPAEAPQTAEEFFERLYGGHPLRDGDTIEVRAFHRPTGQKHQSWHQTPAGAASAAAALAAGNDGDDEGGWDVYYGLGPRETGRGDKGGVTRIVALHADADTKHFGGSEQGAYDALMDCPLEPSLIVHTGGGFHGYWLLAEPVATTPETVQRTEGLMLRLYERLGGLDKVQDISRILRVPGTYNQKYEPPREARVLYESERVYTLDDFEQELPPLPARAVERYHDAQANPLSAEEVRELLSFIPKQQDYSDWLSVCMAVASNFPDDKGTAVELIQRWSPSLDKDGEDNTAEKVASFRQQGVTVGTLIHYAREHGWEPKRGPKLRLIHGGKGNSEHSEYSEHGSESAEWEQPNPLTEHNLPPFPTGALSQWGRDFVEAEATATQTPPDLAGMLFLSTLAAAVAGKVRMRVKEGYSEPLNLYTVTALPPANRKSAVFTNVTAPLVAFEEAEADRLRADIAEAQERHALKKAQLERARNDAARAKPGERAAKEADVLTLARELAALPPVPVVPRLIADDATPEKVASLLHEQGGRLAVMSPEGDVFELMAGRYTGNSAPNFGVFLKGHAGDDLRVDRQGRPAEYVKRPALTLGLTVQPDVLHGLADKPGFRGRGLLARFLYALPQSLVGRRETNAPAVPPLVRSTYAQRLEALLALPYGTTVDGKPAPHVLRLDAGAQEFMQWLEGHIERELSEFGELGNMQDWGGKLFGAVARVAGLLHMAGHAGKAAPWDTPINKHTVEAAWRIGEYLIPHARAAFADMGADPALEEARHILRWLARQAETTEAATVTRRDIHQGNRGRFKKAEAVDAPLSLLVEYGYLRKQARQARHGAGQPASPTYEINPLWITQNAQNAQNSA